MQKKYLTILYRIAIILIVLNIACAGKRASLQQIQFNQDASFERSNLYNINKLFQDIKTKNSEFQDYYFVIIGDSRNLVRSYKLNGFNFLAKQIYLAKDSRGEKRIFDNIKFIVHAGDIVYNGAERMHWINLMRAFSQRDYAYDNYPYLKILAESKPIFPVLGNHEIMRLRIRKETPYRNLADSNKGLNFFRDFFNWNNFIASTHIITPIPGELPKDVFDNLHQRLSNESDQAKLVKHYQIKEDNNYYLKIFQESIRDHKSGEGIKNGKPSLNPDKKQEVINDLSMLFMSLGYHVLPVLSSDSMICYAFEINNMIYLVLDGMSRGWHYNSFSEIKKALYEKKDQHRLHLFSKSDLNGQYEFFRAIADYAKKNSKKLVPFMHHSPLNSSNKIDKGGIEYNLKLMLGVDYQNQKDKFVFDTGKNETFLDDIIFFNNQTPDQPPLLDHVFTSCVHYYEKFTLTPNEGSSEFNTINWHITGGGGGELTRGFDKSRLDYSTMLYNQRLSQQDNPDNNSNSQTRSIEIAENKVDLRYHYLVVHVQGDEIVEVYPQYVDKKDVHIHPSTIFSNVKYSASILTSPLGFGNTINIDFLSLGFEKISPGLAFITWEPGTGFGGFDYDTFGNMNFVGLSTFKFLKFGLNFPRSEYTITLKGAATLLDQKNVARNYWTYGIEAPILYNFFGLGGVAKRWSLGINYYVPRNVEEGHDPDFGKDIQLLIDLVYKF